MMIGGSMLFRTLTKKLTFYQNTSHNFNWNDYLDLAEELKERNESEAALRSAISRAYYAVFCQVRDNLKEEGVQLPEREIHRFVWNYYKNKGRSFTAIYINGDGLRNNRNTADYESAAGDLNNLVFDSFRRVRNILNGLQTIKKSRSK